MVNQIAISFAVGELIVSTFAIIGDLFKPKSFGGLLGAAPSVALATLALTINSKSTSFAAIEAHSMIGGPLDQFIRTNCIAKRLRRVKFIPAQKAAGVLRSSFPFPMRMSCVKC
jgi:hypothetical protein